MTAKIYPIGHGAGAQCDNCGITGPGQFTDCEAVCPVAAIMEDEFFGPQRYVVDSLCINCGNCMAACPQSGGAIVSWAWESNHPYNTERAYVHVATHNPTFVPIVPIYNIQIFRANGVAISDGYSNMLRHHTTVTFSFVSTGWVEQTSIINITPSSSKLIAFLSNAQNVTTFNLVLLHNASTNMYDRIEILIGDFTGNKGVTMSGTIQIMKRD